MVKSFRKRCTRRLYRRTLHPLTREALCSRIRSCTRNLPAYNWGPDYLGQALRALQRAINTHKKLARLAPQYFDSTEVDRLAHLRMEEAERRAMREPILNRVYGCSDDPRSAAPPSQYLPQPPRSPRTRRVVDRECLHWELFLRAGALALARYRERNSRKLPSLSRVCRLIQIGTDLGRLVCGSFDPNTEPDHHAQCLADLERAYGDSSQTIHDVWQDDGTRNRGNCLIRESALPLVEAFNQPEPPQLLAAPEPQTETAHAG